MLTMRSGGAFALRGGIGSLPEHIAAVLRIVLMAILAISVAYCARKSLHWPMVVDSPIMHYVNFLMDHGMRPYREITDNNMPGAYLTERWAMQIFGGGDLGWRIYDFFLLGTMTAAMTVIGWPYDRLAGIYAGGLFSLMHLSEGAWFAGEREEVMAAMLLAGCASLFVSVRWRRPWLTGVFGFLAALAGSIKPTFAPFAALALLLLFAVLRRRQMRPKAYLLWGAGGIGTAAAINVVFLVRYGVVGPFLFVLRTVTPTYVGLSRQGWRFMMRQAAPQDFMLLGVLAVVAVALDRRWNWERWVLLLGGSLGLFSYFVQRKGFFHHRYIALAFLLLLAGVELLPATRRSGWLRLVGCAGLVLPMVVTVPQDVAGMRALPAAGGLVRSMEGDLRSLGTDQLQGEVQCFDLVFGCLNSLYRLRLVENTGFTGDLLLFRDQTNVATRFYQDKFWQTQAVHPAAVFVITNEVFGEGNSFGKIDRWPEFASYLARNYTLVVVRRFPREDIWGDYVVPMETARAYQIYVRNGSQFDRPGLVDGAGVR